MIPLAPTTAIIAYLALTLGILLGLWAHRHYRTRKIKALLPSEELHLCEYCQCPYITQGSGGVTQCPHCRSYNKK